MPAKKGQPKPQGTGAKVPKAAAVKKTAARPKAAARAPSKATGGRKPPASKPSLKKPVGAAPPPPPRPAPNVTPTAIKADDSERDRLARRSRERAAKGREAGRPPNIADTARREACSRSLKLHCETYHPEAFSMGWSDAHLRAIARIEEAARIGALYAFAMARGSGKTTISRVGAEWATLNALRRYVFLIGATDAKATEALGSLKTQIRFNEILAADYPEVSHYARALGGIANRASGQTCDGASTMIEWSSDGIVLPTVPPPSNWPPRWPLRADGMVPTSGVVVATSGLTGDGIRGSLRTLTTGEMVRPDLVLLDDPQTATSARSKTQNLVREQLVSADVLGMAGPGKRIAAVMPCTVIEPGDMADSLLDRKKHPLWRGERSGILKSMPKSLAEWDAYYDVYSRCAQLEPPDFAESNAHYVGRQGVLEEGAEASWPERYDRETEVSAIQHAMHLRYRDPFAFAAEYMNDPKPLHAISASALDPEAIARKATNVPRLAVPRGCTRVTAMIDVGVHVLWYCVVGWDERFNGHVLDYGPYPDQTRLYFAAADATRTLSGAHGMGQLPQEAAVFSGLSAASERVNGRKYVQEETGNEMRVERCLVDANYGPLTELVYDFCRRDKFAGVLLPSHGKYIGPKATPIANWQRREGERIGPGWRISNAEAGKRGRKVVFDTNKFKTFVAERLRTPFGAPGCLSLFAAPEAEHQMFADHCAAEYPKPPAGGGYAVDEWVERVGRDNHLWDCLIGAAVAVSIQGLRWDSGAAAGSAAARPTPAPARPRAGLQERIEAKKREKESARRNDLHSQFLGAD